MVYAYTCAVNRNDMLAIKIFLPSVIMATKAEISGVGRHDGQGLGTRVLGSQFGDLAKTHASEGKLLNLNLQK